VQVAYLAREVATRGHIPLDLNHFVFGFLIAGLLLHWRPRSFTKHLPDPVGSGRPDQCPLYAGMVKMTESGLAKGG
jgi:short subunit fatty acids transporter